MEYPPSFFNRLWTFCVSMCLIEYHAEQQKFVSTEIQEVFDKKQGMMTWVCTVWDQKHSTQIDTHTPTLQDQIGFHFRRSESSRRFDWGFWGSGSFCSPSSVQWRKSHSPGNTPDPAADSARAVSALPPPTSKPVQVQTHCHGTMFEQTHIRNNGNPYSTALIKLLKFLDTINNVGLVDV